MAELSYNRRLKGEKVYKQLFAFYMEHAKIDTKIETIDDKYTHT
jgi:hypothetical protein